MGIISNGNTVIDNGDIEDNEVDTAQIAASAVETAKINNDAVTADKLANTADWHNLKEVTVVYTHTMYVNSLFDIIRYLGRTFIVITHNSDCRIEEQGVVTTDGRSNACLVEPYIIPDNVFMWYSSNVNVVNPKITPIPIEIGRAHV